MGRKPEKKHIGKTFGKLTIIDQIPGRKSICRCECGTIKTIETGNVIVGHITSCGCLRSIFRKNYDEHAKNKLLSNIDIKSNGCWEWNRARHRQGYGHFPYRRKLMLAHRLSWMVFKGELSDDICVCHSCDNPPCVNPDHLFLGTIKDNTIDASEKGRLWNRKGEKNCYAKHTEKQILDVRNLSSQGLDYSMISKLTGVDKKLISNIVHRRCWKHI